MLFIYSNIGADSMTTTGFDCGTSTFGEVHVKTFSLLDVHACSIKQPIIERREFTGQILQTKLYDFREVFLCKVKVKRTIRRCSWFGYLEPVENGLMEFLLDISKDQCKKMHSTRSFAYDSQHILSDLQINRTSVRSLSLAGNAIDNSCNVGSYSDRFGTWNSVNVEGLITITLATYIAKIDLQNDNIMLRSGLVCKYSQTDCLDVENGYSFWENLQSRDCVVDKVEVVYEGTIEAITETRNNVSTLHYFVSHKDMLATLKFNGIHNICHIKFIKTDFANIYIVEEKENFVKIGKIVPDLFTYINAKFVHVEGKTREQMSELYYDVLNKKCESDLAILRESLSLAYLSPDSFAYDLMGPGYMAHLSGELIHIVKCVAVEVEIRDNLETCFNQIPVNYREMDMFLSYKTKILIKHGTERKCNKLLPVGFKIGNTWIIFTPTLTIIEAPHMLSPELKNVWTPEEIKNLATGGLYSEDDMKDYMRQIAFSISREVILDNTAATISRVEEEATTATDRYSIFEYGYWQNIALRYWKSFQSFGSVSSGLIMILIIFYIIKEIVNIFIRGFTLHKVFGFSTKILAAVLSSLTHFVLVLGRSTDSEKKEEVLPTEDMELGTIKVVRTQTLKSKIPKRIKKPLTLNSFRYPSSRYSSKSSLNEIMSIKDESPLTIKPKPAPRQSLLIPLKDLPDSIKLKDEIPEKPIIYNSYTC